MDRAMQHRKRLPITNRALVTLAYNPVSIALYARYGIYPREPLYLMDCPTQNVTGKATHTTLKFERAADYSATQKTLSSIDEQCIGYAQDRNHDFLFSTPTIKCYIFSSGHEPVGYAYIHQNGRIGPLATGSETPFEDAVKSALELAAAEKPQSVSFLATGSNWTLMKIGLGNGMRILDNSLFMSSQPFPNFSQYMLYPMGSLL